MKKPYILKTRPEMIDADPYDIYRLTKFIDWCLRIDGQMTLALEREANLYGKHEEAK